MSHKKTSKIAVKSEVTTLASKKRKRGKDSDGDCSDVAEDGNAHIHECGEKGGVRGEIKR
jgi:hypothetical protein